MERLTNRSDDGQAFMNCEECEASWCKKSGNHKTACTAIYCRNRLKDRLAAYEDTGLEPEDVRRLQQDWTSLIMALDEMGGMPHLRELVQAEQDGRLVVLPCGTDVELVRDGHAFKADHWNHTLTAFRDAPENKSGKQVALFSIKEAALAGKGGEG